MPDLCVAMCLTNRGLADQGGTASSAIAVWSALRSVKCIHLPVKREPSWSELACREDHPADYEPKAAVQADFDMIFRRHFKSKQKKEG